MPILNISCPKCGLATPSESVNIAVSLAKCPNCGSIFSITDKHAFSDSSGAAIAANKEVNTSANTIPSTRLEPSHQKAPVFEVETYRPTVKNIKARTFIEDLPTHINLQESNDQLDLYVKWKNDASHIPIIMFSLIWNSILLVFILTMISTGQYAQLLLLSGHIAVGVGMLWVGLAKMFNTTHISVQNNTITTSHYPIPTLFRRAHQLHKKDIKNLYAERKIKNNKSTSITSYNLMAKMANGSSIRLASDLKYPEQALFLEQEIEFYLGMLDEKVHGELDR